LLDQPPALQQEIGRFRAYNVDFIQRLM